MGLDWNSAELFSLPRFCDKLLVWSLTSTLEPISCLEIIKDQVLEYLGLFSPPYCMGMGQT